MGESKSSQSSEANRSTRAELGTRQGFTTGQAGVKLFLPAVVLVTSLQYSLLFTSGITIGYVLSKIFCNIFVEKGRVDSIFLDYGKWKIHLHHWIMGIAFLVVVWVIDYLYLPKFFAGVVFGIILQDIYDYSDWYKVIVRSDNNKKSATV